MSGDDKTELPRRRTRATIPSEVCVSSYGLSDIDVTPSVADFPPRAPSNQRVIFRLPALTRIESQARISGVVATDRRLDQPVRTVVGMEHFVVVLDVESGKVVDEVMFVGRGEADLGDSRLTIDHGCAHLVERVL